MPLFTETFFAATFTGDHFGNLAQQGKNNHNNTGELRYGRCFYLRIIVAPPHYYRKQTDTEGSVFHAHNQVPLKFIRFYRVSLTEKGKEQKIKNQEIGNWGLSPFFPFLLPLTSHFYTLHFTLIPQCHGRCQYLCPDHGISQFVPFHLWQRLFTKGSGPGFGGPDLR